MSYWNNRKKTGFSGLIILLGIICMGLFLSVEPVYANDNLIVPGVRVDNIVLGRSFSTVQPTFGTPDKTVESEQLILHSYKRYKLTVTLFKDTFSVYSIMTSNSRYRLHNGITYGTSEQELVKLMGKPEKENKLGDTNQLMYMSKGIIFQVFDGKVVAIAVVKKE